MKKNFEFVNIISIIALFISLFLKLLINESSIIGLVIFFLLNYIIFVIASYKKFKSLKNMFTSVDFIYETVLIFYSIAAAIMYLLDNHKPRISFFTINDESIYGTLDIYYYVNFILLFIIFIFNGPKRIEIDEKIKNNIDISFKFSFYDFIAVVITIYYYYLHFRNGFGIFGMYFQDLRLLVKSDINANLMNYLFLYMIIYSFINITKIIYKEKRKPKTYKELFVIILLILFWSLSLLTGRRNLINLLIMLMIVSFAKLKKGVIKKSFLVLLVLLTFLSISFFRSGEKFSKEKINDFIFLSNGEFVLVHYVSEFYYNHPVELKKGSTYIYDTILSFVPRAIYKNKPKMLSEIFVEEAHTNVGYAYNPIAEGLINFGKKGTVFIVPFIIYLFIYLALKLGKSNPLYYIIITGYSINFFRGTFSVTIFALAIMFLSMKLLVKRKVNQNEENI